MKKHVRPKPCAKTFDMYCDLDADGKVARSEWSVCLGVDINSEYNIFGQSTFNLPYWLES